MAQVPLRPEEETASERLDVSLQSGTEEWRDSSTLFPFTFVLRLVPWRIYPRLTSSRGPVQYNLEGGISQLDGRSLTALGQGIGLDTSLVR